jgi:lipid-binding SYLF domain-containing protein
MKLYQLLAAGVAMIALVSGSALAESTKAEKRAELRKVSKATLADFYKADPKLKGEVGKSPGYATFTTYGLSFLIGGSGGKGLVHDRKTGKETAMAMAQASAGVQIGASQTRILIIFKNAQAMQTFVDKGWEFGGGGGIQAGAAGTSVGPGQGENVISDASFFTLTPNGLQVGGAVAGTKFWKDKDLN